MKVSSWSEFAKKSRLAAQREQPVSASPEIPKDSSVSTSQCWDSKHATPQFLALNETKQQQQQQQQQMWVLGVNSGSRA